MKNKLFDVSKEKSAEARNLGTVISNQEIGQFLKGLTNDILPQLRLEAPDDFPESCHRCGRSGPKLFSVRLRSIKLCADCVFGFKKADSLYRETKEKQRTNKPTEGTRKLRLYICFYCGGSFSLERMSCALILCRDCLGHFRAMNPSGGDRQILSIQSRVGRFLRGRQ